MSPHVTPAVKYRIDWDGDHNVVVLDTAAGGHAEMTLEDFVRVADKIINGLFEKGNPGRRKSFDKLSALVDGFNRPGGKA